MVYIYFFVVSVWYYTSSLQTFFRDAAKIPDANPGWFDKKLMRLSQLDCADSLRYSYIREISGSKVKGAHLAVDIIQANANADCSEKMNPASDRLYHKALRQAAHLGPAFQAYADISYAKYLYNYRKMKEALPYFMEAYDLLEQNKNLPHITPHDSYRWIGYYFGTIGDDDLSQSALEKAKSLATPYRKDLAAILDALGQLYLKKHKTEKAEQYLLQARKISVQEGDQLRYAKVQGNLSLIYKLKGDTAIARKMLEQDISISKSLNAQQNTMFAYTLLGNLLFEQKHLGAALGAFQKALEIAESKENFAVNRMKILESMAAIYRQFKNDGKELYCLRRIQDLDQILKKTDGTYALNSTQLIMQKAQTEKRSREVLYQKLKTKFLTKIYLVISILVLLFLTVLYGYIRKKNLLRELLYRQTVNDLRISKLDYEKRLTETEENLKAQITFLKDKNILINKLNDELNKIKNSSSYNTEEQQEHLQSLLKSHLMTEENWRNFKNEFQKAYPDFYKKLKTEFTDLTDSNYRIVLLQKLNFNNSEISMLLGITLEAVKKSKQRMKKKLGSRYEQLTEIISQGDINYPNSMV